MWNPGASQCNLSPSIPLPSEERARQLLSSSFLTPPFAIKWTDPGVFPSLSPFANQQNTKACCVVVEDWIGWGGRDHEGKCPMRFILHL